MAQLAIVRIRGTIGATHTVKETLKHLNLQRQNYCVVVENSAQNKGMLRAAKDYITWGEIDDATAKLLVEKKGKESKAREHDSKKKIAYSKSADVNGKKLKKVYCLNPPKKGYGRKGIKVPFSQGGALGDRKEKINDLLQRMLS